MYSFMLGLCTTLNWGASPKNAIFIKSFFKKGIYGMDFYVVMKRPGYAITKRRRRTAKIGLQHKLTDTDSMKWFQAKYDGIILPGK